MLPKGGLAPVNGVPKSEGERRQWPERLEGTWLHERSEEAREVPGAEYTLALTAWGKLPRSYSLVSFL